MQESLDVLSSNLIECIENDACPSTTIGPLLAPYARAERLARCLDIGKDFLGFKNAVKHIRNFDFLSADAKSDFAADRVLEIEVASLFSSDQIQVHLSEPDVVAQLSSTLGLGFACKRPRSIENIPDMVWDAFEQCQQTFGVALIGLDCVAPGFDLLREGTDSAPVRIRQTIDRIAGVTMNDCQKVIEKRRGLGETVSLGVVFFLSQVHLVHTSTGRVLRHTAGFRILSLAEKNAKEMLRLARVHLESGNRKFLNRKLSFGKGGC